MICPKEGEVILPFPSCPCGLIHPVDLNDDPSWHTGFLAGIDYEKERIRAGLAEGLARLRSPEKETHHL